MKYLKHHAAVLMAIAVSFPAAAEPETDQIDTISVTATREERATKEVPASISVIDEERIDDSRMFNITDALSGTPGVQINTKNGAYDARLIIRGAGLKASYGIREIMLMRDGVPLTDPDSFTSLDMLDTQDIERIEVTKGPGNIYAVGSAGGTIQIISKSVFDEGSNVKIGVGDNGTQNVHARITTTIGENEDQAMSFTYSKRASENDWRRNWNEFDSQQLSVKHGYDMGNDSVLETELSYTKSDLQLPGSMDQTQFDEFLATGIQTDNNSVWKHSGRYSEKWFFNTKLEKKMGDFTYQPRLYATVWSHYHPVTGKINVTDGVTIIGTDQEFSYKHQLLGDSTLVAGLTLKQDRNKDDKKYKYRDYNEVTELDWMGNPVTSIAETLSDVAGDLMETQSETNNVIGIFAQESMRPNKNWLIDAGFRLDKISLKQDTNEITTYDYSAGNYVTGDGLSSRDKSFNLFSANIGASYKLNDKVNLFFTVAQGDQVPFSSELDTNENLKAATSRNYEVGFKGRDKNWEFDTSVYYIRTTDEVVKTLDPFDETLYLNAGSTDKKGLEFSGSYNLFNEQSSSELRLGASYAYSHYRYDNYIEGSSDYSGNQFALIPEHQYSLFLTYANTSGFKARLQSDTWGEYYIDNANTEKYEGYEFITSLNVSYETGPHTISVNAQNITDKNYAVEVTKSTYTGNSYTPGAPRNFLVSYRYKF